MSCAQAATVSVHASVDWSQFTVVATDTGSGLPSISFVSREDESTAAASAFTGSGGPLSDQGSDDASGWTSGTLAVAGLPQADGSAQTGAELLANVGNRRRDLAHQYAGRHRWRGLRVLVQSVPDR